MVARLQRILTSIVFTASLVCLAIFVLHGNLIAGLSIFLGISFGYSLIIAAELVTMLIMADETMRPPPRLLFSAWWAEVLITARIFYWRQPYRSQTYHDSLPKTPDGRPAVLLVHGLFCNRGFWNPWMKRLRNEEIHFSAINLEPVFGSISSFTGQIDDAVSSARAMTGSDPIIVAHSMGGLAVRCWLKEYASSGSVRKVITIGTPHKGTWLAKFSQSRGVRDMAVGSPWLLSLAQPVTAATHALFTCFYSDCDNVVFPTENATLRGADNRLIRGAAHAQLAFHPEVIDEVFDIIRCNEINVDRSRIRPH